MKTLSIRSKLTLWFSVALILVAGVAFLTVRTAGKAVLTHTIREYLVGTVEQNAEQLCFVATEGSTETDLYIPYAGGFLKIDMDFMEVINNVHTALYTSDGTMLYGENPLAKQSRTIAFSTSHLWRLRQGNVQYNLYDRKLHLALPDGTTLWIRGVVSETGSVEQLREMTRLSLLLLPVLILLCAAAGYFLSGRLLAPIRKIEQTAEAIADSSDLHARIPIGKSRDEIGRLTLMFNRMLDRLERTFAAEQQFTTDISHELRTPTTVILMQSEYTLEHPREPAEYREALSIIQRQGQKMHVLIDDMLTYARMEQQMEKEPPQRVDLSALVTAAAAQTPNLTDNNMTLHTEITEGIWIRGHAAMLTQLVKNLVGNAYKYGKPDGAVTVSLQQVDQTVTLCVKDNGIGIPEHEQKKIFDRFYRGENAGETKGTGLGLAIVQRVAEQHHATLYVESAPNEGSRFVVSFKKT